MSSHRNDKEFDRLLEGCVSSTLQGVLGETPAAALLFHLGSLGSNIDPKGLASSLERVLGGGSVVIEKLILKNLSKTLGAAIDTTHQFDFGRLIVLMRDEFRKGREEA